MSNLSKKELAQKRNYFKYVISGIPNPVDRKVLTDWEETIWEQIINLRELLILKFDNNSREKGLNVPKHKCWCGREAKYQLEESLFEHGYWVCKKHLE